MRNKVNLKILLNFARPYLITVLIVFLIQSFVIYWVLGALENNALSTVDGIIKTNITEVDRSLQEVQNTAMSIAKNDGLKRYFNESNKKAFTYEDLIGFKETLLSYYTNNDNILDICLQNNRADMVINFSTAYSSREKFYKSKIKSETLSATQLLENSVKSRGFSARGRGRYDETTEAFPFILQIPMLKEPTGSINVYIANKELFSFLNTLTRDNAGCYVIKDTDGNIVAGSEQTSNKGSHYVFSGYSENTGWDYSITLEKSQVLGNLMVLRNVSLVLNFFALLMGLVICFYIALKKSKDYENVMDILSVRPMGKFGLRKNEFEGIYSAISSMNEKNEEYLYGSGQDVLKRLLDGDYESEAEILARMSKHNISISEGRYGVLVIDCDHKRNTEFFAENFRKFMVQEIGQIIPKSYIYFANKHKIVVILAVKDPEADFYDFVRGCAVKLECDVFSKYNIGASFGSGGEIKGLGDVKAVYGQANEVISYGSLTDHANVNLIFHYELPCDTVQYYYPEDTERLLYEYIERKHFEGAKSVLEKIKTENFSKRNLSLANIKKLLSKIKADLEKCCDGVSEELSFDKSLTSVKAFFAYAENVIYLVCKSEEEAVSRDKSQSLCQSIRDYLDINYQNSELSLVMLAEEFDLNPSYLSLMFKKHMNYTWSSYLEAVRLGHAVHMLEEGTFSIKEIAERVGFNSDVSFRRCFKRVKGVNPTKYRK